MYIALLGLHLTWKPPDHKSEPRHKRWYCLRTCEAVGHDQVITKKGKQDGTQQRPLWYTKSNWHNLRLTPINRCHLRSSRKACVGENGENWENSPKFGEYTYEVAKGPFCEWRFCPKRRTFAKVLTKIQMRWQICDFDKNGEFGENSASVVYSTAKIVCTLLSLFAIQNMTHFIYFHSGHFDHGVFLRTHNCLRQT